MLIFFFAFFLKTKTKYKEIQRKLIHIGMGPLFLIAKYLEVPQLVAEVFTGFIILLILFNYKYRIVPFIEDIERQSFGTIFYCISLLILIFIFWDKHDSALIAGVFVMTFGDGLAGLIGKSFKSFKWKIFNQQKSLLGTSVMLITSFIVVTLVGNNGGFGLDINYFLIAILATILEQFSVIGIDNFSVPIITSTVFHFLIKT